MSVKSVVSEYMQVVWVQRKIGELDRFVAADLMQHNPNLPDGAGPLKAFLGKLFGELSPHLEWRVLRVITDGDLAAVHSLAISEPGTRGTVVVDLFRVAGGKIVEHWDVAHDVPETTASGRPVY